MDLCFSLLSQTFVDEPSLEEAAVQSLVARARRGDGHAAGRLYTQFVARTYRAVRPLCCTDAEAEDVVQDTFVQALSSLNRYRSHDNTRFIAWLCTIALNRARTQRTRRRRRAELLTHDAGPSGALAPAAAPGPDVTLERRQLRQRLLAALADLSERDREVLTLRFGAELSAPEVATACGVSADNVRKICERQRAHLLARLSPPDDDTEEAPRDR